MGKLEKIAAKGRMAVLTMEVQRGVVGDLAEPLKRLIHELVPPVPGEPTS